MDNCESDLTSILNETRILIYMVSDGTALFYVTRDVSGLHKDVLFCCKNIGTGGCLYISHK